MVRHHAPDTELHGKGRRGGTDANDYRCQRVIWTVDYGKGRVFHTPMGHGADSMRCVSFSTTLQRGTEWAATAKVTLKIPENFPTEEKTSSLPK